MDAANARLAGFARRVRVAAAAAVTVSRPGADPPWAADLPD
jgi:hypothetical protein